MRPRLKPLHEQVVVVTGASSGIGLATARLAAGRGARVLMVARDGAALERAAAEIRAHGGDAVPHVADVADQDGMRGAAEAAEREWGRIDTWVNNAGVSIYGPILEVPLDEQRRLFETDYWGVVIGSLVAAGHLRRRGGALINIGSVLSDRAILWQGPYSAAKHAVKGFTDALRMELEADGIPISVTLVKPGTIDTGFEEHARNRLPVEPVNPPPVYAPEVVARAVLHAAEHPVRDLFVGGGGRMISLFGTIAPRLTDMLMERFMPSAYGDAEKRTTTDALFGPSGSDGRTRGGRHSSVRERSFYTAAAMHPWATAAVSVGVGALAAAAIAGGAARSRSRRPAPGRGLPDYAAGARPMSGARWPEDDPRMHEPRGTGLERGRAASAEPSATDDRTRIPIG
jgi:NAD(P)-dependent dehydrogenase (short-subunit alcohol dehydrogenase family)